MSFFLFYVLLTQVLSFVFQDESLLIWYSGKEEKHLKLSQVSKIIPGQRTVSLSNSYIFVKIVEGIGSQMTADKHSQRHLPMCMSLNKCCKGEYIGSVNFLMFV